jgi:hypothetical protein
MTLTRTRHCERSEANHGRMRETMDCFATLAMTAWFNPMPFSSSRLLVVWAGRRRRGRVQQRATFAAIGAFMAPSF